jgi:hypothetical protein
MQFKLFIFAIFILLQLTTSERILQFKFNPPATPLTNEINKASTGSNMGAAQVNSLRLLRANSLSRFEAILYFQLKWAWYVYC